MARTLDQDFLLRLERLIAERCAVEGRWTVTFEELSKLMGVPGKLDRLYRYVSELEQKGIITILRSSRRDANTYIYSRGTQVANACADVSQKLQDLATSVQVLIGYIRRLEEQLDAARKTYENLVKVGEMPDGTIMYAAQPTKTPMSSWAFDISC